MGERVQLYKESARPLREVLAGIRELSDADAAAWKESLLISLERMARRQPSLAHLTAIEILNAFRFSINKDELAAALGEIKRRPLRGATSPRQGLHPLVLILRYRLALECFEHGIKWKDIQALWRSWGGSAMPEKTGAYGKDKEILRSAIEAERNAHERSLVLLATSQHVTKAVMRNALSRAGALSKPVRRALKAQEATLRTGPPARVEPVPPPQQ